MLKQRIFSIAIGYEDTNDSPTLRNDPALKTASSKLPENSLDLASQPTLCRFENSVTKRVLRRLADRLFTLYLKVHMGPRDAAVIDIDATDDPTHGGQQLSFFHGYYEEHMYHPLLVLDGITGFPMVVVRADGGFAVPGLYRFCEKERIHYVIGLITNERLKEKGADLLAKAERRFKGKGQKQRLFTAFRY